MNRFFVSLLLFGFIGVGIVGVSMMGSHDGCLFGRFGSCSSDALAMVSVHFDVLQTLSAAVFSQPVAFVLALIVLLAAVLSIYPRISNANPFSAKIRMLPLQNSAPRPKEVLCRWLALHENSPSVSLARA